MKYKKSRNKFREIDHTADIGLEIHGENLQLLFANAAFAFYHLLFDTLKVPGNHVKKIMLRESSLNDLFIAWLSELNYFLNIDHFIMNEIRLLSIQNVDHAHELNAEIAGNTDISYPEQARFEIKAVTYHQFQINKNHSGYHTRIFFDI